MNAIKEIIQRFWRVVDRVKYFPLEVKYGVGNLFRWFPLVWRDRDFDWDWLARIMEYKLWRMSKVIGEGSLVYGERYARQMRICAALLKRMQEDEYFVQAGYDPKTWRSLTAEQSRIIADRATRNSKNDSRYLGLLIGKYFMHWWS